METRRWPLETPETPAVQSVQVARLQRDIRTHRRVLDGESQNHIEVLTGKRLQQLPVRDDGDEGEGGGEGEPVAPVLTTLDPSEAALGTPSFTLHVRGEGFTPDAVIVWNGGEEPTTFVSATELTTGVNMDTAAYAVPIPVEVVGPGGLSNALTFTFTDPAPPATR